MSKYYLSLGSNIQPEINLKNCVALLQSHFKNVRAASFYETDPVGPAGEQLFWNTVVEIDSTLQHDKLSEKIRSLEDQLGRVRDPSNKFAMRTIDIDILPQKNYQSLGFIIIPLAEIAPNEIDPETKRSYHDLAEQLEAEVKEGCRLIKF